MESSDSDASMKAVILRETYQVCSPCCTVLCRTMLCYAMLCYAMLCYAMLCYAMLCYVVLCYAMLCCAVLCYAMLCYAVPHYYCTLLHSINIFLSILMHFLLTCAVKDPLRSLRKKSQGGVLRMAGGTIQQLLNGAVIRQRGQVRIISSRD